MISYFPQAVEVVDIGSDGDLEVIVPLNKGYRTGIDTRHHFSIFENENGVLGVLVFVVWLLVSWLPPPQADKAVAIKAKLIGCSSFFFSGDI